MLGKHPPQSITGQWALRPNLNNLRAGRGALVVTNLISNVMDMSRDVENLYVSPLICYGLKPMPILVNVERLRVPTWIQNLKSFFVVRDRKQVNGRDERRIVLRDVLCEKGANPQYN
jgi:hypothetical protein